MIVLTVLGRVVILDFDKLQYTIIGNDDVYEGGLAFPIFVTAALVLAVFLLIARFM